MIVRSAKPWHAKPSEITPQALYLDRRRFIRGTAIGGVALAAGLTAPRAFGAPDLGGAAKSRFSTAEELTSKKAITSYNNFYEFGTDKGDPARTSVDFKARPWTLAIGGEVEKPDTYDVDALIARYPIEERIYRLRCVEAWSMVIPWIGFELNKLIAAAGPTSRAKFVAFETLHDPERMPGQRPGLGGLAWPYREGLRIDEAMHPLTIMAVGLYGAAMPNQNGAPIRLVVPWKYGFKSIKSVVKITLVGQQPQATWNMSQPEEYGFYSNVNPELDHPRWSQKKERRIGEFFRRDTLKLNGYAEEVAQLYAGMSLSDTF